MIVFRSAIRWLIVAATVRFVKCKVYEPCELAKELVEIHEIPLDKVATWVCIAKHESDFNTSAVGHLNYDGSGDHGLFQISDLFWCSPPGKGWACGVSCDQLEDDDIEDDVACIKRIYNEHKRLSGDGFNAWAVYSSYCQASRVDKYIDGCFDDDNTISTINNTAVKYQTTTPYTTTRKIKTTTSLRSSSSKTPKTYSTTNRNQQRTLNNFHSTVSFYETTTKSSRLFGSTSRFRHSKTTKSPNKASGFFTTTKFISKYSATTEPITIKRNKETGLRPVSRKWSFSTWPGGLGTVTKSENKVKRNLEVPSRTARFSSVGWMNTFGGRDSKIIKKSTIPGFSSVGLESTFGASVIGKPEGRTNAVFNFHQTQQIGDVSHNTVGNNFNIRIYNQNEDGIKTNLRLIPVISGFSSIGLRNTFG